MCCFLLADSIYGICRKRRENLNICVKRNNSWSKQLPRKSAKLCQPETLNDAKKDFWLPSLTQYFYQTSSPTKTTFGQFFATKYKICQKLLLLLLQQASVIPHICHRHHRRCLCKFFLSGVKLSLLNMKMVHVFYKHCVIYRKMCKTVYDFHGVIKHLVCSFVHSMWFYTG